MDYRKVFESEYKRGPWLDLLRDLFGQKAQLDDPPSDDVSISKGYAKEAFYLGRIEFSSSEVLGVYEVELSDSIDIVRNRRGIRDMLTADWRGKDYVGAFVLSHCRRERGLTRFSYVSEVLDWNDEGKYEKKSTDTKRYTYLLGEGQVCNTALGQFQNLRTSKQTLFDVSEAFSVEALTELFYKELFKWFQWATKLAKFPTNDKSDTIESKVIRLITRIMFVWFIKQKRFVSGKLFDPKQLKLVLKDFDARSPKSGSYYNAILQNLFFATLNCEVADRKFAPQSSDYDDINTLYRYEDMFIAPENAIELFSEIPFLNGGLFECLDKKTRAPDGKEHICYYDGFSSTASHQAFLPNILFFDEQNGLIPLLSRYNFTVEENSHNDMQVALDPELLGKVFENLLAAYNPETRETARKQTGSFYTPREIVNYMSDQSLINFLGDTTDARKLFSDSDLNDEERSSLRQAAKKLEQIKIFDPACGSGAFPVCLLNRITEILLRVDPSRDPYDLKRSIIKNCLYGADIQCIATQITKLRFFISLICDSSYEKDAHNFGITPLPNLETQFVAANSLLRIKKNEGDKKNKGDLLYGWLNELKSRLEKVRGEHFSARTAEGKAELREKDKKIREELKEALIHGEGYLGDPSEAKLLAGWDPYDQNGVAPFFDPEWMFGVREFDIVIGNPPYINMSKVESGVKSQYIKENYETFAKNGDIYCLFYERGQQLLKSGGHLCFITSNKWMRSGYGEKLRGFFANNTNPKLLIDFGGLKIFKSATVDTNILLFSSKSNNELKTRCAVVDGGNEDRAKNLSNFVEQEGRLYGFSGEDMWIPLSEREQKIKDKIEEVGTPLKDWDVEIRRGILTGCNEVFIISEQTHEDILKACGDKSTDEYKRTDKLMRRILRGQDIDRYSYTWAKLWLINTHNGVKGRDGEKGTDRINIKDYPVVKAYLDKHRAKIEDRDDQGDTFYNLRNCAYLENFSSAPKIVYQELTKGGCFAMDHEKYMVSNTAYIITGKNLDTLLHFLNSKLINFAFKRFYGGVIGKKGIRWLAQYVYNIPIPKGVQLSAPNDEEIYKIYGLEPWQIDFVKSYKF